MECEFPMLNVQFSIFNGNGAMGYWVLGIGDWLLRIGYTIFGIWHWEMGIIISFEHWAFSIEHFRPKPK